MASCGCGAVLFAVVTTEPFIPSIYPPVISHGGVVISHGGVASWYDVVVQQVALTMGDLKK